MGLPAWSRRPATGRTWTAAHRQAGRRGSALKASGYQGETSSGVGWGGGGLQEWTCGGAELAGVAVNGDGVPVSRGKEKTS
jgi:hypothetical protein